MLRARLVSTGRIFGEAQGFLCVLDSWKHGPWASDSTGLKVGAKLAAVTVDEVFAMGLDTPIGQIPTGTVRIWRTSK